MLQIEARDAGKHTTTHRTRFSTMNSLVQSVNEVEKPCLKQFHATNNSLADSNVILTHDIF